MHIYVNNDSIQTDTDERLPKDRPYLSSGDCADENQQLQKITDTVSRQRGRYNITNSNCLKEILKEIEKLVAGPRWAPDTKTDWPTDCRS
jgi:hypothetical protein